MEIVRVLYKFLMLAVWNAEAWAWLKQPISKLQWIGIYQNLFEK